jgi:hypothetical protein
MQPQRAQGTFGSGSKQPKDYRDTLLQAFHYVGAERKDARVPDYPIVFALVYQERHRHIAVPGQQLQAELINSIAMDALELAFNSFRVGHILNEGCINFRMSHNRLWSAKKRWSDGLRRGVSEVVG